MPSPYNTHDLPVDVNFNINHTGEYVPSENLVNLLVTARESYSWPANISTDVSQRIVRNLEVGTAERIAVATIESAHEIVLTVSEWAGNNALSHRKICKASNEEKAVMKSAISCLCIPGKEALGIENLCKLSGINLVIASKIFRFCAPQRGAAVDRHASYFFNSLPVVNHANASDFIREWSNGRHNSSRLAVYSLQNFIRNRNEYVNNYLITLNKMAIGMNALGAQYICAVTSQKNDWRPADVEMAAYYWWACNGAR